MLQTLTVFNIFNWPSVTSQQQQEKMPSTVVLGLYECLFLRSTMTIKDDRNAMYGTSQESINPDFQFQCQRSGITHDRKEEEFWKITVTLHCNAVCE